MDTLKIGNNLVGFFEGPFLWQSPPRLIGKTQWLYTVYWHSRHGAVTGYFWFDPHYYGGFWRPDKEHPRYNPHDGTHAGLPHGVVKLYRDNQATIKQALLLKPELVETVS